MSLYLMGTYFHSLLGTYSLNASLLGCFISVLTIIGNRLVMIWVVHYEEYHAPVNRLFRLVDLRRFLRCYAVAGNLLHNVIISHIEFLCSRTNDLTTREAIMLTRSTSTWWWTLHDVHQMAV